MHSVQVDVARGLIEYLQGERTSAEEDAIWLARYGT